MKKAKCWRHNLPYTHLLITGIADTSIFFKQIGGGIIQTYVENKICVECIDSIHENKPTLFVNGEIQNDKQNDVSKYFTIREIDDERNYLTYIISIDTVCCLLLSVANSINISGYIYLNGRKSYNIILI